mmetsp:Transcript_88088/g.235688  ORF Transcript_88088/g.235688 Transcript_88088/m.235688 type:complete len:267 (+) Transcript_88088:2281-3081(+)
MILQEVAPRFQHRLEVLQQPRPGFHLARVGHDVRPQAPQLLRHHSHQVAPGCNRVQMGVADVQQNGDTTVQIPTETPQGALHLLLRSQVLIQRHPNSAYSVQNHWGDGVSLLLHRHQPLGGLLLQDVVEQHHHCHTLLAEPLLGHTRYGGQYHLKQTGPVARKIGPADAFHSQRHLFLIREGQTVRHNLYESPLDVLLLLRRNRRSGTPGRPESFHHVLALDDSKPATNLPHPCIAVDLQQHREEPRLLFCVGEQGSRLLPRIQLR